MFAQIAKSASLAAALSMAAVSFSVPAAAAQEAAFEPFEIAQTVGMERRQDRRNDRTDDRQDRRYDRQDCRSAEGIGMDKRDCKQDARQDRNMDG